MQHLRFWLPEALIFLFLVLSISAKAQAVELSLNKLDEDLVVNNFPLHGDIGVVEAPNFSSDIDGCKKARKFYLYEDSFPNEVIVALCDKGNFGPGNVQTTIDNLAKQAMRQFSAQKPDALTKVLLSGLPGIPVSLGEKRTGHALTVPVSGHGIAMVPLAYAVDKDAKITIFIQALINPNNPRNLNAPMAMLLKAIDRRLHQTEK